MEQECPTVLSTIRLKSSADEEAVEFLIASAKAKIWKHLFLSQFRSDLEALGFDIVRVRNMWKFTHIRALKTERKPQDEIELRF